MPAYKLIESMRAHEVGNHDDVLDIKGENFHCIARVHRFICHPVLNDRKLEFGPISCDAFAPTLASHDEFHQGDVPFHIDADEVSFEY